MMSFNLKLGCLVFLAATFLILPTSAALNTVSAGGIAFIGEQGLDISSSVPSGASIGWWGSGASLSDPPTYQVVVSDNTNFFVDPAMFGSRMGPWYNVTDKRSVFNVVDPSLSLKIYDKTVQSDRTGTWIPWGDEIQFIIQSNLNAMTSRGGGGAPVTIKIQTPTGAILTSVIGPGGTTYSLDPVYVTSDPFTPSAIWNTDDSAYSVGSYQIWAECNANHMKDNYNVVGKTTTQGQSSVGVQNTNPIVQTTIPTTVSTTVVPTTVKTTATPTTVPTTIVPATQSTIIQPTLESTTQETTTTPYETFVVNTTMTKKATGFDGFLAMSAIAIWAGLFICQKFHHRKD